ncbi:YciI family protein [Dactylosporangium fulvum]|uniref:YciI family protein n=1 Tax=Dactylosporangium fulvum TaxID=53359 RepID=A0ABY5W9G6_9ACTN|nr:YciI family protein [Dactylosporangium fulvum]UWP84716.1 YciI family protein [Dactylosporangium fulvum]
MFVITLSYLVEIDRIDEAVDAHREWLDGQYEDGVFLASGAQVPRTGGVILAAGLERLELEARLALDPFKQKGLAEYTIVEFVPRKVAPGLERLQS